MVIADAAQFYEEVSQDEIVKALKWVTRRAKQMEAHVVTVFPGKAPARVCLCTTLYSCQKRGCLDTPTN